MPSYRVILTAGALRPGVRPDAVLPAAGDAAAEVSVLEASSLAVERGAVRLTVRFTADTDEIAEQIAAHVVGSTEQLVAVTAVELRRRQAGRWPVIR